MRSLHADKFNHDEDAPDYDADVADESDPIRAGYAALLDWVVTKAALEPGHRVLELGSGTGNLTTKLTRAACKEVVAIDISTEMTTLARRKLGSDTRGRDDGAGVAFVESDLLAFFDQPRGRFDRVVSTYTVHHLTEDEKRLLFSHVRKALGDEGRAVFGDLMFENAAERARLIEGFRHDGDHQLVETIEDELFWDLESAEAHLRSLGFEVERRRFSALSWGLCCSLPPASVQTS